MRRIILASQSPRRKELLTKMGVAFDIIPRAFEEHLDDGRPPERVAVELGLGKAWEVAARLAELLREQGVTADPVAILSDRMTS